MGSFKKGIILGGLIGGALMWLNTTKKGKQMRAQMLDHATEVYDQVKERISETNAWQTLSESAYVTIVKDVLDKYVDKYHLTDHMRDMVEKIVKRQYKTVKKQRRGTSTSE